MVIVLDLIYEAYCSIFLTTCLHFDSSLLKISKKTTKSAPLYGRNTQTYKEIEVYIRCGQAL